MAAFTQYFSAASDADAARLVEDGPTRVVPEADQVSLFSILLTECSLDELVAAADEWSQIEEIWGGMDADLAAHFLFELRLLASGAAAANAKLYCWVCL